MQESLDEGLRKDISNRSFKFYRDFHNAEEAKSFIKILDDHEILYSAETTDTILDKTIVGTGLLPTAIIKLLPEDFKKVNSLIHMELKGLSFDQIKDHHLNQLDNDELIEILEKPDEWSIEDASISKIILMERGIDMSDEDIKRLRKDRLTDIRKGKKADKFWLVFYFLSIPLGIFVNYVFPIAGIAMGYYYAYGTSTDIDGNKFFIYDEETRNYGSVILYGGIISLLLGLLILFGFFA